MSFTVPSLSCLSRETEYALQVAIAQLGNPRLDLAKYAVQELDTIVRDRLTSHIVGKHVDSLLSMTVTQMRNLKCLLPSASPLGKHDLAHFYLATVSLMTEIFKTSNVTVARQTTAGTISDLLHTLISTLIDPNLTLLFNGILIRQQINVLVLQILKTADTSAVICGIMRLVNMTLQTTSNAKLKEIVLKCESQLLKLFPEWSSQGVSFSDSNIEGIIREFHSFNHSSIPLERSDVMATKFVRRILAAVINFVGKNRVERVLQRMEDLKETSSLTLVKKLALKSYKTDATLSV